MKKNGVKSSPSPMPTPRAPGSLERLMEEVAYRAPIECMAAISKSGFDADLVREPVLDGLRRGHAQARGSVRMRYADALKEINPREGVTAAVPGLFESADRPRWEARYLIKDAEPAQIIQAAGGYLQAKRVDDSRILVAANDVVRQVEARQDPGARAGLLVACVDRLDLIATKKDTSAIQRERTFQAMILATLGSARPEVGALLARQFTRAIDEQAPYWARHVLENGHVERYHAARPDPESLALVAGALMRVVQAAREADLREAAATGLGIISREVP